MVSNNIQRNEHVNDDTTYIGTYLDGQCVAYITANELQNDKRTLQPNSNLAVSLFNARARIAMVRMYDKSQHTITAIVRNREAHNYKCVMNLL